MASSKRSPSFQLLFEKSKHLRLHSTVLLREAEYLCSASHQLRNAIPMVAHDVGLMRSRAAFPTRLDPVVTGDSGLSPRLSSVEVDAGGAGSDVEDRDYFQLADIDHLDGSCF